MAWFLLYGLYFGLTEGAEKALIADLAPSGLRGTAFGLYNAALGVGALLASVGFGIVWKLAGAPAAFALGAALSLVATVLLFVAHPRSRPRRPLTKIQSDPIPPGRDSCYEFVIRKPGSERSLRRTPYTGRLRCARSCRQ